MDSYEKIAQEVRQLADNFGQPIDPKIQKTVIALRLAGIETDGSCEGHADRGFAYPWVEIAAPEQEEHAWKQANQLERQKILPLIEEFYRHRTARYPLRLVDIGLFGAFRLQSADLNEEIAPDTLADYQSEMDAFADFVIKTVRA